MNDWNKFDLVTYIKDNYSYIHYEDEQIIKYLIKFYSKHIKIKHGLDIGTGPNLYPIFTMLPIANRIESIDYNSSNVRYLQKQTYTLDSNWRVFFNFIQQNYRQYGICLKNKLKQRVFFKQGNIYKLSKNKYDTASMFFVAESITNSYKKFIIACRKFMMSVKSGGSLVASFMAGSSGYYIGKIKYEACFINRCCLRDIFSPHVKKLKIYIIKKGKTPLRPGYKGMLLLTATRK
jgi:hypothetical protein